MPPVHARCRIAGLEHAGDERIVFAATFERVDAPGLNKAWSLLVAADSFVLMTSATHCHAVGFNVEDDADLAAIINRQQEFVQSSEAWEHRADESITPSVFAKKTVDSAAGWNDE